MKPRLAIVNWSLRVAGGVERYIASVLPPLMETFDVALISEADRPSDRDLVGGAIEIDRWCVELTGLTQTLAAVTAWQPDVFYVHRIESVELLGALLDMAPAVRFVHDYSDTCISGLKTWQSAGPAVCSRRLGWGCLLHYFPHRCGGLNPATMFRRYAAASQRARLLPLFHTVTTTSRHMQREVIRHGVAAERAAVIPTIAIPRPGLVADATRLRLDDAANAGVNASVSPWRILFIGRMDDLKGGSLLIASLERVATELRRPVALTFAGDGPARGEWEAQARAVASVNVVTVHFAGWVSQAGMDVLLQQAHLLAVPSIWAEPFGVVGPEAGTFGVPAVAFAVGGIPDWLHDGVNGHLAPADPPTAEKLADAIVRCLSDPVHYGELRTGAAARAAEFSLEAHITALTATLSAVL